MVSVRLVLVINFCLHFAEKAYERNSPSRWFG